MIYAGVDIAKRHHVIAAIDEANHQVLTPQQVAQSTAGFADLLCTLASLAAQDEVTIGMEATGHYWILLAESLTEAGYTVQVFNPILTGSATQVTVRGRKTDADDSLRIARVVRDGGFNSIDLRHGGLSQLKQLCRQRLRTVERRADLTKRLQGLLDVTFPEWTTLVSNVAGAASLALLDRWPSARLMARARVDVIDRCAGTASRGRFNRERAVSIKQAAKESLTVARQDAASELAIRHTIAELRLLSEQVDVYDQTIAEQQPSKEVARLQTIPGIGPILAATIMAEITTIDAFTGPRGTKRLLAFAGLDPRVQQSGAWQGRSRMSKRGSRVLRTAIWRAAVIAARFPGFEPTFHHHRVVKAQPYKVAISHVARKIVQAIFGVLKYRTAFDAQALKHGPLTMA